MALSTAAGDARVILWTLGAIGQFLFLIHLFRRWIAEPYAPEELNPTWFLPSAGALTAPMTAPLDDGLIESTAWCLFGVGFVFWVVMLTIIVRRLIADAPMPAALRPSLFILFAPAGLAANAWFNLAPESGDVFPVAVSHFGLFMVIALVASMRFVSEAGVTLGWWSTTFPTATLAAAFLRLGEGGRPVEGLIGAGLLALATLFAAAALIITLRVAWRAARA